MPSIEWRAPEDCPQAVDVVEGVEHVLGKGFRARETSVRFEGEVQQAVSQQWNLALRMYTADGSSSRTITGASCHELTQAAVAVIALALNPDADIEGKPVSREADEGAADAESLVPTEVTPPTALPARSSPHDTGTRPRKPSAGSNLPAMSAFYTFDPTILPAPASGAGLAFAVPVAALSLAAHALYFLPERTSVVDGQGGEIALGAAGMSVCYPWPAGRWTIAGCGKAEAGWLFGEGVSPAAETGNGRWFSLAVGPSALFGITDRMALSAAVDAWVPLVRDQFRIDGERVYQTPTWGVRGFLGGFVRFP